MKISREPTRAGTYCQVPAQAETDCHGVANNSVAETDWGGRSLLISDNFVAFIRNEPIENLEGPVCSLPRDRHRLRPVCRTVIGFWAVNSSVN